MSTPTTAGGPAASVAAATTAAMSTPNTPWTVVSGREDDADPPAPAPVHAQHRIDRHPPHRSGDDPPVRNTRPPPGVRSGVTDTSLDLPLSVLDLAPVGEGSTPTQALRSSLVLAAEAERLGYRRYWVAEHHNMPGIASSSPPVLLAHAAGVTETIRLGSGGVMLPNHASLVVAEQFGMLEALHPGRIDLGIGRAPGTDQLTARALRRSPGAPAVDDFPEQLVELMGYFSGEFPEGHPYARITAVPGLGHRPELWLLGSSDYSAQAAGVLGLPFSFAHHFAAANTEPAVRAYRAAFRPSADLDAPYVMLGVSVVCAETVEEARWLAGSGALAFLRLRSGRPGRYPTPEEASRLPLHAARARVGQGVDLLAHRGRPARRARRPRRARRADRRRRADGHDADPQPRRPPGVIPPRGGRGRAGRRRLRFVRARAGRIRRVTPV